MNFFNNTVAWIKGEIFEGILIAFYGLAIALGGVMCRTLGTTLNAKALFIPFVAAGMIYAILGASMYVSNHKRLPEYEHLFHENQPEFIQFEKNRVEGFQYMYTISKIVATVFFTLTLLFFWFSKSSTVQGWGIGLTLFALSGLIIDYFSQERAGIYYKTIVAAQL